MIDISTWIEKFVQALNNTFADRVWFVGLQGSYARGEANENSDIDVVVILDELSVTDIHTYNSMLDTLPYRELICGFISGRCELSNWEPSDLFQFYNDTKPIKGNIDDLLPLLNSEAIDRAIKIGACNIYHGCVHNLLYEKSNEILRGLYKSACFVIQAISFRENGKYTSNHTMLCNSVSQADADIVAGFLHIKDGGQNNFNELSETLFVWASNLINSAK